MPCIYSSLAGQFCSHAHRLHSTAFAQPRSKSQAPGTDHAAHAAPGQGRARSATAHSATLECRVELRYRTPKQRGEGGPDLHGRRAGPARTMRLEFLGPLSRKRLAFSVQA